MIFAYAIEIGTAWIVAIVFGEISPNTRISSVTIPVAIPAPLLPNISIASVVAIEEAERFTTLFPIRIALSIFPEFSVIFNTVFALSLPSSLSFLIRILLTVVSAVSADEKNAESIISTTRIMSRIASLESKKSLSFTLAII